MERKPDYRIFAWIAAGCFVLSEAVFVVRSAATPYPIGFWGYASIVLVLFLAVALLLRNKTAVFFASVANVLFGALPTIVFVLNISSNSTEIGPLFILELLGLILSLALFNSIPGIPFAILALFSPRNNKAVKPLFFAICALRLIWLVMSILLNPLYKDYPTLFQIILSSSGEVLAALWLYLTRGTPQPKPVTRGDRANSTEADGFCPMSKHVLLLLFTFGVWYYIWIYRTTRFLNRLEDEEPRDPTNKLLLCLFVPFYSIYWVYKSAQRIDKLAAQKNVPSGIATTCLVLAILVGIIPPILMQDKINAIVTVAPGVPAVPVVPAAPATVQPPQDNLTQIKRYKELLDCGAITQEEYDAKKKQLLDL